MSFRVEQAIFTSIRGERMAGYQLTSRSSGIDNETAQLLSNWGPAHDALESRLGRSSLNVHAVGENQICISFTQLAGAEYSGRGGGRVYTHSFLIERAALEPFQFNPFQVFRAFRSAGRTQPRREPPPTLDTFPLVGRATQHSVATRCDAQALFDDETCEKLIWALSAGQPVYLAADDSPEAAIEVALSLLAEEERAEISFTTGLRISPRRPFQLQAVPVDQVLLRQLQRNEQALVVQLPTRNDSPMRETKSTSNTR